MASKSLASTALLLSLNVLFFTLVSSHLPPPPPTMLAPSPAAGCPQLGVCVKLVDDLVRIVIGRPPNNQCCSLLPGVLDLQASVCLCAAIRARAEILGIVLDAAFGGVVSHCGRTPPPGFRCPQA